MVSTLLGVRSGVYTYMNTLRQLDHPPATIPPLPRWAQCSTPIRVPALASLLSSHPDLDFVTYVLRGLSDGFHVGFDERMVRLRPSRRNHPSSLANRTVISSYIQEEVAAGRMIGPLSTPLHHLVHRSPIGLVPKGHNTGQWRMIVDLSHPNGESINDGVPASLCSLSYASVENATQFIKILGHGTLLIKIDLKSAYRVVPIHPTDRHLFGIEWNSHMYIDQALPFGLRSAPKLFTAVADAIGWALTQAGIPLHIHYLDDFLFFIPPDYRSQDQSILTRILDVFYHLGVPVAPHKIEGPAPIVIFLGIEIDTVRFELRLPDHKRRHVQELVRAWRRRRAGPYSEFESLLGHLSHAATVIRQGRIFVHQLFVILSSARSRQQFVHLGAMARADLTWWDYFLQSWNGTMFFQLIPVPSAHVYTDASGSFGCGGFVLADHWFQLRWPASWSDIDIAVKELVPIVIAAALWGHLWYRKHIRFHCDNAAVVDILKKRSARNAVAHHLLRCLYFYAAFYQFDHSAEHVPGVLNIAADALSRDNIHFFSSLVPQAVQSQVSSQLLDLLVTQRPDWGSQHWTSLFIGTLIRR